MDIRCSIITTFDEITRAVIENAKNLKLIACTRATPVNVDMAAAKDRGISPICDDQVQILGGDIKCAAYTYPGTPEMAETVLEALDERNGALIANHGSIAIGRTLKEALVGVTVLEKTAQIWIDVQALGGAVEISKEDCEYYHDFFMNKYGQKK